MTAPLSVINMENAVKKIESFLKNLSAKTVSALYVGAIMLIVFLAAAILRSNAVVSEKKAELSEINSKCEAQEIENAALEELLQNSDDEYIELIAREHDYVRPGERVYIVRSGN